VSSKTSALTLLTLHESCTRKALLGSL